MNPLPNEKDEIMSLSPNLIHHSTKANVSNNDDNNNNTNANRSTQYEDLPSKQWSADFRDEMCTALKKVYNDTYRRMELERFRRPASPITCTIKTSLKKVISYTCLKFSCSDR